MTKMGFGASFEGNSPGRGLFFRGLGRGIGDFFYRPFIIPGKKNGREQNYLLGPGISIVAQFPEAQLRSLTWGMDWPPLPELPILIFDITRLISGDWQEGQTGSIRSWL
jgi:hypothetical protein